MSGSFSCSTGALDPASWPSARRTPICPLFSGGRAIEFCNQGTEASGGTCIYAVASLFAALLPARLASLASLFGLQIHFRLPAKRALELRKRFPALCVQSMSALEAGGAHECV